MSRWQQGYLTHDHKERYSTQPYLLSGPPRKVIGCSFKGSCIRGHGPFNVRHLLGNVGSISGLGSMQNIGAYRVSESFNVFFIFR